MENETTDKKRHKLIALRATKTQKEVAEDAGISREFYNQIENGVRNPTLEHVKAICRALGVPESLEWF